MDTLLTIPEVMARLSVSESTVRRLLREQELVGVRIGQRGQWRVHESMVTQYIREHTDEKGTEHGTH